MNKIFRRRALVVSALLLLILAFWLWTRRGRPGAPPALPPIETSTAAVRAPPVLVVPEKVPPTEIKPEKKKPLPKEVGLPPPTAPPPPIQIHKELIPKDISIVRVYYANTLSGPDSTIEFDINGSGFTKEFERMIQVDSGHEKVSIRDLRLVTPNQIHGILVVSAETPTTIIFPKVLISKKVVFVAPDPFAVIRPGEVLNFVFTEMGENGRTGRFRVFTNLTEEMYRTLSVSGSSPTLQVTDLTPSLPFVVDGTLNIGPTPGGDYGVTVKLGDRLIWKREGVIRVVRPNVGESGLVQRVLAVDGFHRPGDQAKFVLQGSGFRPEDANVLGAVVPEFAKTVSSFSYIAPGRLELTLDLPAAAPATFYTLRIVQGGNVVQEMPKAFQIVGKNWTRGLAVEPALVPGGQSVLRLNGRDIDRDFAEGLTVLVDEPALTVSSFDWVGPTEASATVSAAAGVAPGDYLLQMESKGRPVTPEFGSIIRVEPK